MKTFKSSLGVGMLVLLMSAFTSALYAQGRGRGHEGQGKGEGQPGRDRGYENPGRGHDRDEDRDRDNSNDQWGKGRDHRNDHRNNDHDRYDRDNRHDGHSAYRNDYDRRRYVTYHHHRHGRPQWAPHYGYRYNTRYIFYQDYNVYYDCHRDMFITWTGRNWAVSSRIPDVMFRVDFNRARVRGVEYWDDDFDFYLQRRQPNFVSIQIGR